MRIEFDQVLLFGLADSPVGTKKKGIIVFETIFDSGCCK
jgi:hypothetical protein